MHLKGFYAIAVVWHWYGNQLLADSSGALEDSARECICECACDKTGMKTSGAALRIMIDPCFMVPMWRGVFVLIVAGGALAAWQYVTLIIGQKGRICKASETGLPHASCGGSKMSFGS